MLKRSRHYRPVRWRSARWDQDVQALPPKGWCPRCGMEIYAPGRALCEDCEEERK